MGTIKDSNGEDLRGAEEIKKRWQEYTEELCKKGLNDMDNCHDVVTHLEQDILEYEIKWTLGSIHFSCLVVSDSLQPHELQHARPPCPSPTPGVHSDSRPSSQ